MINRLFTFTATVWLYEGPTAWHFVTLPVETSHQIDFYFSMAKKGWGSLPVTVKVGKTTWDTSLFPDKKTGSYILPLKSEVRKAEEIRVSNTIEVTVEINAEV